MSNAPFICLVDDSADYCMLVDMIARRYLPICTLHTFADGQAFLDALAHLSDRPDLVLLDQHMTHLTGHQTLVLLKQHPDYKTIPVIIMSGAASPSEIASFHQAGATTYLLKPLDFEGLRDVLHTAYQHAVAQREA